MAHINRRVARSIATSREEKAGRIRRELIPIRAIRSKDEIIRRQNHVRWTCKVRRGHHECSDGRVFSL